MLVVCCALFATSCSLLVACCRSLRCVVVRWWQLLSVSCLLCVACVMLFVAG